MEISMMAMDNIKEIKFINVGDNTFSISIESDVNFNGKQLKETTFEAQLCKINSTLELKCNKEYSYVRTPSGQVVESEYYNIPLNIKLLLNRELNEFFSIKKEEI